MNYKNQIKINKSDLTKLKNYFFEIQIFIRCSTQKDYKKEFLIQQILFKTIIRRGVFLFSQISSIQTDNT